MWENRAYFLTSFVWDQKVSLTSLVKIRSYQGDLIEI